MTGPRKRRSASFKAKIALKAAKQTCTPDELPKAYQVDHAGVREWLNKAKP
jgi:hypothetical protein